MILSAKEEQFIRYLADCFDSNKMELRGLAVCRELNMSQREFDTLIRAMESLGAVENLYRAADDGNVFLFNPKYRAVELVREIDATHAIQEPPDFVEQIQKRIKQSPVAACVIIALLAIAVVSPIYGMVVDILERIGWIGSAVTGSQ